MICFKQKQYNETQHINNRTHGVYNIKVGILEIKFLFIL